MPMTRYEWLANRHKSPNMGTALSPLVFVVFSLWRVISWMLFYFIWYPVLVCVLHVSLCTVYSCPTGQVHCILVLIPRSKSLRIRVISVREGSKSYHSFSPVVCLPYSVFLHITTVPHNVIYYDQSNWNLVMQHVNLTVHSSTETPLWHIPILSAS